MGVEASILLPLIIMGLLTLAYMIKICSAEENLVASCVDENRNFGISLYSFEGKVAIPFFEGRLMERLRRENDICETIDMSRFRMGVRRQGIDKLITYQVDYSIVPRLPINFGVQVNARENFVFRPFVGRDDFVNTRGFASMEEEEKSETVWIFPRSGSKYHRENCGYIKVAARKCILTGEISRRFSPCKICNASEMRKGETVYCFFTSGNSYHRPSCSSVDRYVEEIEKSRAIEKGYKPCSKCGG